MINTTCERLKERNFFICRYFSFYEQLKFHAQLSTKNFITSGSGNFVMLNSKIDVLSFELLPIQVVKFYQVHLTTR